MPWPYLPELFRDAARVTKRLGLQYLWIDALWIVQDSAEDWTAEASKMAEIYGNAYLTIAADSCGNDFQGLSGEGPHRHLFFPAEDGNRANRPSVQFGSGRFHHLFRSKFQTPCPSRSCECSDVTEATRYGDFDLATLKRDFLNGVDQAKKDLVQYSRKIHRTPSE